MKLYLVPFVFCCSLLLSACGSLLASVESNSIEDDPGERTMGRQIEDESIETKMMVNIHAADDRFDDAHLVIVSYNGYALIAGQVASLAFKQKATMVGREVRSVRRIYNELEVASPSSGMTRTSDTWITAKVKSWLLGSSDTQGLRVKVVTENGVVYLMGLATQEESERIAAAAAKMSGVQRVVRLFEIVN
ncbi:MAG: osmotically-inducible protein OsmY [Halieaceae bacterium]|jgi:osmotically-inducible protein OsmY